MGLFMKNTAHNVNKTVKNIGYAFKNAATGFNENVKPSGYDQNVADNVNDTEDVRERCWDAAIDVNDTVKNTVNTVTTTAVNVNDTVQNTVDIVKGAGEGVTNIVKSKVDIAKSATAGDATESSQSVNVNVPDNKALMVSVDKKRSGELA